MCLAQDTSLYLCCQFHAQFRFVLARFKFHFSFCGCPFFSSSSGMVTTTQGMFSLLPIGRHLCSFARIFGYKPRCFGLQRRQNCPTLSSARYHVFGTFPTLFLESGPRLRPHHNGDVASNVLTFEFLDLFAIKLTLLAVRYLQFPFSCHPLTRRRQLRSL